MRATIQFLSAWLCGVLAALWLGIAAASAADAAFPAPGDAVPGADGVTYLDLLREIVPDLEPADAVYRGTRVVPLRHIAGPDNQSEPPQEPTVADFSVLPLEGDGRSRILILVDLGMALDSADGYAVLALFDPAATPRLVDAADVAFDRMTWFLEPVRLDLGGGRQAVLTVSMHSNSSQAYVSDAIILIDADRLSLVDSVFTFSDKTCAFERGQEARITTSGTAEPADIVVTVTERTVPTGADCGSEAVPEPPGRTILATYSWNAAESRYVVDGDALRRLASENAERF